jgi:hypothetical protein
MKFRVLLLCLIAPIASAQTKFLGSYPAASPLTGAELMPVVQGGSVLESSPLAMLTYIQSNFAFSFSNIGSGTNLNGTMTCGPGCTVTFSGNGNINANQINGLTVPQSSFLLATNSSGQLTPVSASTTGCVNITGAQIFSSCVSPQQYAIAGLPTCNGTTNVGTIAVVTNGVASPTYLAAVSATGAANRKVFCDGTGWFYD